MGRDSLLDTPVVFHTLRSYILLYSRTCTYDTCTGTIYRYKVRISIDMRCAIFLFFFCAGATSNVFLAIHAATLKMVALKEVTVSTDADRRAVRTEMRALRSQRSPLLNSTFTTDMASCPRIVDYYGSVVRENGNACIAVEYVAGGSLENWLENSGGSVCPEPWFAHIAHQALEVKNGVFMCVVVRDGQGCYLPRKCVRWIALTAEVFLFTHDRLAWSRTHSI